MKSYKIFINAVRPVKEEDQRPEEKMFMFEIEAETSQDAAQSARDKFDQEHASQGWKVDGVGTMTF